MGIEIERKFLLAGDGWRAEVRESVVIRQGYFPTQSPLTLRARRYGDDAVLTFKGPTEGGVRPEFEFPIPPEEAEALLATFPITGHIEKTRHLLPGPAGLTWEIDEFHGTLAGCYLAELEIPRPDFDFDPPAWVGREVTEDPRYSNQVLAVDGWPEDVK